MKYRMPTTEERVKCVNEQIRKYGNKNGPGFGESWLQWGKEILMGVGDGSFLDDGKPMSSDPTSPDYKENWRDLVYDMASDLVMELGQKVFQPTFTRAEAETKDPL
jgi:hypothetical protein